MKTQRLKRTVFFFVKLKRTFIHVDVGLRISIFEVRIDHSPQM